MEEKQAGVDRDPDEADQAQEDRQIEKGRLDLNDDTPLLSYRVVGHRAIIDGVMYTDADGKGGFACKKVEAQGEDEGREATSVVTLSRRYANVLMSRDVRLECLDDEGKEDQKLWAKQQARKIGAGRQSVNAGNQRQ